MTGEDEMLQNRAEAFYAEASDSVNEDLHWVATINQL